MESPFKHHFNTNYAPSVTEVHQIREFISQPLRELASLNDKIAQMQSIIDHLMRERDNIVDQINVHRALISPARRLPRELVQGIFMHCLPTKRNAVMSSLEAPVLLGRICSAWRRTALSTPHLWSSLHVVSPGTSQEKFSQRFDCFNAWLGRSGALPLSISLVTPPSPEENACKFMASLVPLSRRWKAIDLHMPRIALRPLLELTKEDVPMLETIKLLDIRSRSPFEIPWKELDILGASRLRDASFPNVVIDPLELPLPWAHLTELCLKCHPKLHLSRAFPSALALRLLSQCPKLVSCTLQITTGWRDLVPPNDPIVLPLLRSFHLEGCGIGSFFDHLILPELHDISTINLNSGTPEQIAFGALLARSPSLGSIALTYLDPVSKSLIECLQLIPSLTRLRFAHLNHVDNLQNTLLHLLTPTQASPGLCPALETIELLGCRASLDEALLRFLHARLTRIHPDVVRLKRIEVVFVHSDSYRGLDILSRIQPLIEAGTEVSLIYPHSYPRGPDSPWEGLLHELPPPY